MKKILLLLTAFSAGIFLQAQSFQKAISIPFMSTPIPKSIVQCSDGGYLVSTGGNYFTPSASSLMKMDATGQVVWTKAVGSASGYMDLIQAGECVGGGYYIFGDNTDSSWMTSGFSVTKMDASGNVLWAKSYPNSFPGYGSSKIRPTTDGGFLISQSLQSKMGALKLDGNGNILWSSAYSDDPNDQSPKCPSFDCFIGSDGSMVFSGKRNSDILLVKTNSTGQMQWSSTIGNGLSYYHANGISNTADGGYIVCGYDDFYPFAMKVTATGAIVWYHAYSSAFGGEFSQIKELANGNFIAVGAEYYSGSFIVILDPNGSIVSSSTFGNGTTGMLSNPTMCVTADGGYAIAGSYHDQSSGLTALAVMKTDANGNFSCNFNYYQMSFLTSQMTPSLINVPIYTFTQPANSTAISANVTNLNPTVVDFCVLFSADEQPVNTASLSAYPSPVAAGENLSLNISGAEGLTTISIYDANGRAVKTMTHSLSMSATTLEVSTLDLSSGIYLVRMTSENNNVLGTTRFIVR